MTTILYDFYATRCSPCKAMMPVVDEIAAEHPDITVEKVNVDQRRDLVEKYGISSVPTFIVERDGEVVARETGRLPKERLEAMLYL